VLLEELYLRLLPWISSHANVALWLPVDGDKKCPKCGSKHLRFKGYKRTKVLQYKQYLCKDCGTYSRERYADKPIRKDILR
jgi:transposase-like protein